jgi:hypothetical protein
MKKTIPTTFKWDRNLKTHVEVPLEEAAAFGKNGRRFLWVGFHYKELMTLASIARNPLLAVLAELYRLHFRAWDKREPIVFNCSSLGLSRWSVMRALKVLERQGWISIQLSKGHSARVKIIKGFYSKE